MICKFKFKAYLTQNVLNCWNSLGYGCEEDWFSWSSRSVSIFKPWCIFSSSETEDITVMRSWEKQIIQVLTDVWKQWAMYFVDKCDHVHVIPFLTISNRYWNTILSNSFSGCTCWFSRPFGVIFWKMETWNKELTKQTLNHPSNRLFFSFIYSFIVYWRFDILVHVWLQMTSSQIRFTGFCCWCC